MKSLLIVGSGGHSRAVVATLKTLNLWDLIGIIDINYQGNPEDILGVTVLGSFELINSFNRENTSVFLAVGENNLRKKFSRNPILKSFDFPNIVHPTALIDPSAELDSGNFVGPFAHIGPMVKIGKSNIINSYANLEHETQIGSFCMFAPGAIICGRCKLGDQIFVGANATVIENRKIADQTTIGAGAVITKDILQINQTFVGVPGRSG
jgi:sugar O-acyltransferase (sialic acid O-acetyltransferase NeuD family)